MKLSAQVRSEPVLLLHVVLSSAVMMYFGFIPHLTPTELASIATIVTALTAAASAFLTKPVNLGTVHTSVVTILVAATAFGLHLSSGATATLATSIVAVLGYLLREKVSPVVGTR